MGIHLFVSSENIDGLITRTHQILNPFVFGLRNSKKPEHLLLFRVSGGNLSIALTSAGQQMEVILRSISHPFSVSKMKIKILNKFLFLLSNIPLARAMLGDLGRKK